mmetsp:Transcript_21837/g.30540  ORF Transcript_21837/g.30540 Transcript_21837/m.30540 type:complete len:293 (+) Transcript_21837:79-957(+)
MNQAVPLFSAPCWIDSITTDSEKNIFYTTRDGGVWQYNRTTRRLVKLANVPRRKTSFNGGIVWKEHNKKLYMCHTYENLVLEYDLKSRTLEILQSELMFPHALCFGKDGQLFVAERYAVQKVPGEKQNRSSEICNPIAMVQKFDTLFVCEREQNHIRVISLTQGRSSYLPFRFERPKGICADNQGNILVIDKIGVRRINLAGKHISTLPIGAVDCIAVDSQGDLIVSQQEKLCMVKTWLIERVIWVGHLKNDPTCCLLATLPTDLVRTIVKLVNQQFDWITDFKMDGGDFTL